MRYSFSPMNSASRQGRLALGGGSVNGSFIAGSTDACLDLLTGPVHLLYEPLGVGDGRIEIVRRLVPLEHAGMGSARSLGQESRHILGRHRPEGPGGKER